MSKLVSLHKIISCFETFLKTIINRLIIRLYTIGQEIIRLLTYLEIIISKANFLDDSFRFQ